MDKLTHLLRLFILRISHSPESTHDTGVIDKLKGIEASQYQIMQLLEELKRDEVPRNTNRIYKIGAARTALFLNELLPQVYLTLVSVLQGVALAVLVDEFHLDYVITSPTTFGYIVSSFLIIVAFWHSYLISMFAGRWPFRFVDTLLFFLAATTESIAIHNVTNPPSWCLYIGAMCVVVALIYYRQVSLLNELVVTDVFEERSEGALRILGVRIYTILFLIVAGIAFYFVPITRANPQNIVAPLIAIALPISYIFLVVRGGTRFGIDALG